MGKGLLCQTVQLSFTIIISNLAPQGAFHEKKSMNNNSYYEPFDYDDRTDEIEELTWQLMKVGGQFDYKTSGAISETLSEMGIDDSKDLQDVIDTGDYAAIGRKVIMMAMEYMEHHAKKVAEFEIND